MTSLLKAQALARLNDTEDRLARARLCSGRVYAKVCSGNYKHLPRGQIDREMDDQYALYMKAVRERDEARKAYDALSREQARARAVE